ncbi:glycosyltransferase family 2 protein [Saxibacter everestensis]|uniref:Glycosyltransferase family 2 protein n=1 Tax=Saxibacter everestensis TaxID=2909229 RepID=A0ABY8QX91_9MICO|nr:glycosyltransferase family 2 protein [Brevibacteriaceae bacterium ZFBP1038]
MSPHKKPLVSLVVPAKDSGEYLLTSLGSLGRQFDDPRELEVIVINDGSVDDTGDIAEGFSARLPGLRVLHNDTPTGLANARNQGVASSVGRFIAFLDADDWLAPGQLPWLARNLKDLDVDFIRVDHISVQGRKRSLRRAPFARRGISLNPRQGILPTSAPTMVDYPYAWAGMFNRRVADAGLLDFPTGLHTAEDRSWIWRLHLQAESFAVLDSPGIYYRRGIPGSLTQIFDRRQLDFIPAFAGVFALVAADDDAGTFWPKAARNFLAILAHQVGRSEQMTGAVRRELQERAANLCRLMPADVLDRALSELDQKRFAMVRAIATGNRGWWSRAAGSGRPMLGRTVGRRSA